jgi:TctA family transporter
MTNLEKLLATLVATLVMASLLDGLPMIGQGDALVAVFLSAAVVLGAILYFVIARTDSALTQLALTFSPSAKCRLVTEIVAIRVSESGPVLTRQK